MLQEHQESQPEQPPSAEQPQRQCSNPASPTHTTTQHPPAANSAPIAAPMMPQIPMVGQIHITLVQAKLSRSHSFVGITRMDPYVRVRFGHSCFVTETALNADKAPRWNQTVVCPFAPGLDRVHLEILDEKTFGSDQVIASTEIRLPEIIFSGNTVDDWYPLDGELGEGTEGLINVVLSYREVPARMPAFMPTATTYYYPPAEVQPPIISEEDVTSLKELFPDYDQEVIRSVLVNKGGNKEAAADALLAMSQPE